MSHLDSLSETGISLTHFSYMDNDNLLTVKETMGLAMNLTELRTCQSYYQSVLARDPRAEELYLFDSMIRNRKLSANTFLVAEMKTDSKLVADTFADLMARRHTIKADSEHPPSLTALAGTMETYLSKSGRKDPLEGVAVRFTSHRDLILVCEGYIKSASTGNQETDISVGTLVKNGRSHTPIRKGDYVYAILDTQNSFPRFEETLIEFLSVPSTQKAIKKAIPILDNSLPSALTYAAGGLQIHSDAVTDRPELIFAELTLPVFGILITAAPEESADLLLYAQRKGLHIVHIATVIEKNEIRIPRKNGETTVFHASFLRSLVAARAYSTPVNLPENSVCDVRLTRIGTCTLGERKNALVKTDATGENPYVASLLGILYALLHCFAAGASLSEVGLACRLELPLSTANSRLVGASLAAILGMYRMQAEFELFGNSPTSDIGDREQPLISAVTVAPLPEHPISSIITGASSNIFYLEPLYTEDDIPDFRDLKNMLTYLEKLNREGHILSMLPTGGNLIAELEKMSGESTVEYKRRDPLKTRIGGLLVETDIHIQGALVATSAPAPVTEAEPEDREDATQNLPTESQDPSEI